RNKFCDYVFNYGGFDYCYRFSYISSTKESGIFKNMATVDQLFCQNYAVSEWPVASSVTFRNEAEFRFVRKIYRIFDRAVSIDRSTPLLIGLTLKNDTFKWADGSSFKYAGFLSAKVADTLMEYSGDDCRRFFLYRVPTSSMSL
ncbi:unnamed protein product, partial [Gongylonema pulchrum]|uniref:C-type lectin domain-containing protein n=1 Tax=Gongylonema pulchrum TaxID=637853 RepID=A0A183ERY0_9BILA